MSEIDAFLFVSHLPYAFCCSTLGDYLMESQCPKHHLDIGYSSSSGLAVRLEVFPGCLLLVLTGTHPSLSPTWFSDIRIQLYLVP